MYTTRGYMYKLYSCHRTIMGCMYCLSCLFEIGECRRDIWHIWRKYENVQNTRSLAVSRISCYAEQGMFLMAIVIINRTQESLKGNIYYSCVGQKVLDVVVLKPEGLYYTLGLCL
jgi:hypothetical protein